MAVALCLCAGAAVSLAGCGEEQSAEPGATQSGIAPRYLAMMREVLDGDPSALESEVLADYVIDDGEFQAAVDEFQACMTSHGLEAIVQTDPLGFGATEESQDVFLAAYANRDDGLPAVAKVVRDCAADNLSSIGLIYSSIHTNPEATSFVEALRECLASHGLDADAFSDAEVDALANGEVLPGLDKPEVQSCVEDPFAG